MTIGGIISYFVIQHLNASEVLAFVEECSTRLCSGGRLLLGFWHGSGYMEFPEEVNVKAMCHQLSSVSGMCKQVDLHITRADVQPDLDMGMDMGFVEAMKK